ncbi:MAG: hypothetical protein ABIE43_03855 [Patescibacteria group bacterium]
MKKNKGEKKTSWEEIETKQVSPEHYRAAGHNMNYGPLTTTKIVNGGEDEE